MATPSAPAGSVVKSVTDAFERIAQLNATLNAFITLFEAEAMEQAREVARKALRAKGIPLKDISSSKLTEYANIILEKKPQIMEGARKIVEDRKAFQVTLDPGDLDAVVAGASA